MVLLRFSDFVSVMQRLQVILLSRLPLAVWAAWFVLLAFVIGAPVHADSVTGAQRQAASEHLLAIAAGDGQALAASIHPAELDRLRFTVVQKLRDEAGRNSQVLRSRLFGEAMTLADIERMTSVSLFRALVRHGQWHARKHESLEGLSATREGERTHVLVKQRPPRDSSRIAIYAVVTLLPYGREWRATLPADFEAAIDDLLAGRITRSASPAPRTAIVDSAPQGDRASAEASAERSPTDILSLLDAAERALLDGRCDRYYREFLSPELRRSLSGRILDDLIGGCRRSIANREVLIAALRIVKRTAPVFEAGGERAVYDVSAQGLPYDRFVIERVEGRWYIAE